MTAAHDAVTAAETARETAREQYEQVSARVVREFARFRRDKASDMKKMIVNYVNVQVCGKQFGFSVILLLRVYLIE